LTPAKNSYQYAYTTLVTTNSRPFRFITKKGERNEKILSACGFVLSVFCSNVLAESNSIVATVHTIDPYAVGEHGIARDNQGHRIAPDLLVYGVSVHNHPLDQYFVEDLFTTAMTSFIGGSILTPLLH
jgi:hypothetical protein